LICAHVQREKRAESLLFADAPLFIHEFHPAYARTGKRAFIKTSSERCRYNVLGALNFAAKAATEQPAMLTYTDFQRKTPFLEIDYTGIRWIINLQKGTFDENRRYAIQVIL
jgi:hypothetical protein